MTRRSCVAWMIAVAPALGGLLALPGCGSGGPGAGEAEAITKAEEAGRDKMRAMYAVKSAKSLRKKKR